MLVGEELAPDGSRWTLVEIAEWAAAHGLELSIASLSRHKSNHLHPAIQAAVETERIIAALSQATGKTLSLQSAVVNVIASKALTLLNNLDLADVRPERALEIAVRAVDSAARLARTERMLVPEVAKAVGQRLATAGLSESTIAEIEEQILGLRR